MYLIKLTVEIFFSEFVLYDLNRTVNEEIGREIFDYNRFPENQDNSIVISYKNVSSSMLCNTFRLEPLSIPNY